jgi:hypothetical protein
MVNDLILAGLEIVLSAKWVGYLPQSKHPIIRPATCSTGSTPFNQTPMSATWFRLCQLMFF